MKVLFAAVEMAPVAKVGGLADVVGALPKKLRELGVDARVVIPHYAMLNRFNEKNPIQELTTGDVAINHFWHKEAQYGVMEVDGVPVYVVNTDEWFHEAVSSETLYRPGVDQYLFFSSAVFDLIKRIGWVPEVIHCHDWQTGLMPVILREKFSESLHDVASVYTLHNYGYQGEFDFDVLNKLGLDHGLFNSEQVEAYGHVNFLKSGMVFADRVNTVSPTYAHEITTSQFGAGLDGLATILERDGKLSGILNGIDLEAFDPSTDPTLHENYSVENWDRKYTNKAHLERACGFVPDQDSPILGMVSRISSQKGYDLVLEAGEELFNQGIRLVVLGVGEERWVEGLRKLAEKFPGNAHFFEGFHEGLANSIYAGSDGFLMPSHYEPCGLGQMIAMRYGSLPIARLTGGLADTVIDGVNGFTFKEAKKVSLLAATGKFVAAWRNRDQRTQMIERAMNTNFSWDLSAKQYIELYQAAINQRSDLRIQSA